MKLTLQKISLFSFFLFAAFTAKAQTTCDCSETFKWVKETFEKNDAGFDYAVQQKGMDMYEKHNAVFLAKVKTITESHECAEVLNEWLKFFRKGHFGVMALATATTQQSANVKQWPVLAVKEKELRSKPTKDAKDLAGIWKVGAYKIGIVKKDKGYKGVILESGNVAWKPQQVKMEINEDGSGVFYMGDFSPLKFKKMDWVGKNAIKLAPAIQLQREYPTFPENADIQLYAKAMSTGKPFMEKLSEETLYLRIPSFGGEQKKVIDSVLSAHEKEIKSTKNLIIDIRNGTGGDDDSYANIIPYLYTNPIRIVGMELLSTPLNNKRMESYLSMPDLSEKSRMQVNAALTLLNDNLGKFVDLSGGNKVHIQKMDAVLPFPQQVAIIANEANGSTDEQFLMAAKQSKKVKLFGTSTFGVLDISNMNFVKSPDEKFQLGYCLSKSYRIPGMAIDGIGIQPDYFIDSTIPNELWIKYAASVLEDKEFQP